MDEELIYATNKGYEFTINLWCSHNGESPMQVKYTPEEVEWAIGELGDQFIHFVWDGMEPGLEVEWDIDSNLPMYTRDWLSKGFIEGYRVDGVIYHPADVEIIHRGTRL